jgi:hypothetical protein
MDEPRLFCARLGVMRTQRKEKHSKVCRGLSSGPHQGEVKPVELADGRKANLCESCRKTLELNKLGTSRRGH